MKKIVFLFIAAMTASLAQASLGLSVNDNLVSKDTTIIITEVETDPFMGNMVMGWNGLIFYNQGSITVYIERSKAGLQDELCAGSCVQGSGELKDTLEFNLTFYPKLPIQVYAHYYPEAGSSETIKYRFVGAEEDFTLTVVYDASQAQAIPENAVKHQSKKIIRNGQVLILRDGVAYDVIGNIIKE